MDMELSDAEKVKILNSTDLYDIMQRILLRENKINQDREHFWVIGLSHSNRLLFIELVSKGTVNKTLVEPMEVYSLALQKRAVKVMLVHNHPSGELEPSAADKDITDRLIQVGLILNTEVLDHLIISGTDYLSFNDMGLMDELKKSTKWVPEYKLKEQIQQLAAEVMNAKERAYLEKIGTIKGMIEEGMDLEAIARVTGVSVADIEKLQGDKE